MNVENSTENEEATEVKKPVKKYVFSSIILGLAVVMALFVAIQTLTVGYINVFGYSIFRVVTGSMEPTIPVNSVLVCKKTDASQIEVGDVICFKSKERSHYGAIVTHRVVSISEDEKGRLSLESRGDANYSSDPYYVTADNLIGKVIWYAGKEGVLTKMLSFVSGQIGFLALIVLPVLLAAGFILQSIGRSFKHEIDETLINLAKREKIKRNQKYVPDSSEYGIPQIKEEDLLPGFKTLTKNDYEEIYNSLKNDILKELNDRAEKSEEKTEYSEEDKC